MDFIQLNFPIFLGQNGPWDLVSNFVPILKLSSWPGEIKNLFCLKCVSEDSKQLLTYDFLRFVTTNDTTNFSLLLNGVK